MPGSAGRKSPWANLTPEQYEEWCDHLSDGQYARWSDPEKRAAIIAAQGAIDHTIECDHPNTARHRRRCRAERAREAGER